MRLLRLSSRKGEIICRRLSSTLPNETFAVIIGGGVVGSSVAYHLAKRGIKELLLLEKGSLTSGTLFHSPGLITSSHPAHRYKPVLAYTVELYSQLEKETGEEVGFHRPGTLRLATTQTRYDEFRRYVARDYYKEGDVCRTMLISAEEVKKKAPLLDTKNILGALFTSGDGYIDTRGLTRALAKGAQRNGATVLENCPPMSLTLRSDGEWDVTLEGMGTVRTRNVVNAAGLWANDVARLTNLQLPIVHVEHQYAKLGPIAELSKVKDLPVIIDHDSKFFVRQYGNELLFGGFESDQQVVIREEWAKNGLPPDAKVEPDFNRIRQPYEKACELLPCLKGANIAARGSAFLMTPDGYPLVGPIDDTQNYWLQAGYFDGVTTGGGIGRYLADWMIDGEPPTELFDTDANRFARWATRPFILEKTRETYSMFYNWAFTNRTAGRPTNRVSGIYGRLRHEGCQFIYRNGWEVPSHFNVKDEGMLPATTREYMLVTNKCGVIDMSWKSKIEVRGPDSSSLVNYVLANQAPPYGSINTGLMVTRSGRILSPLKVFHHDTNRSEYILISDPERESRDLYWIKRACREMNFNAEIHGVSDYLASLALVGPSSRDLLAELTKSDVSETGFPPRTTKLLRLANVPTIAARSSTITGLLSYEFFHNRADTLKLYQAIHKEGKLYGLVNFGQAALNSMRIEHGYKLWGRELTLDTNPFECGLGHLVDFEKKEFIGRSSLLELSKKQYTRKLVLLALDWRASSDGIEDLRKIPQGNEVVRREGSEERIGQITSGAYSVRLQRPMAFAWINSDVSSSETINVDLGFDRINAKILDQPPAQEIS